MSPIEIFSVACGGASLFIGCLLMFASKQIAEWIGPRAGGHPFFAVFRTLGSVLLFVAGPFIGLVLVVVGALLISLGLK